MSVSVFLVSIPPPYIMLGSVIVHSVINVTIPTSTPTLATFDAGAYTGCDDYGIFNPSFPTQLIVPATLLGYKVTHIQVHSEQRWKRQTNVSAVDGVAIMVPLINGINPAINLATYTHYPIDLNTLDSEEIQGGRLGPIMPATAGDVWTLSMIQHTGQDATLDHSQLGLHFWSKIR